MQLAVVFSAVTLPRAVLSGERKEFLLAPTQLAPHKGFDNATYFPIEERLVTQA